MQGDVSFTFLDRIEEVELNTVDRRWQPALALTLPDICGERCWQRRCEYLHQKLQFISEQIMLFYTPESAKTKLGKHKPDLWIVTEDMTSQPNQPWRADRTTPVILITGNPDAVEIKKNSGKLTVLSMPLSIVDLRKNVEIYVS